MRIIQGGLLLAVFMSVGLLHFYKRDFDSFGARSVIFISALTSLSPMFHYISVVFPGKLESSIVGTNLGVVIQAVILGISSVLVVLKEINFGKLQPVGLPIVFLGIYVIWAAINGVLLNQSWFGALSLMPIILAIALGKFSTKEIELGLWLSLTIISLGAFFISLSSDGLTECRFDKCLVFSKTFDFAGSQNGFSISVALLGIALMYIQKSFRLRLLVFCIFLYLTLLGGSRSAVSTLLIIGTVLIFSKVLISRIQVWILMKITFVISLGISLLPVYVTFSDEAFTSRGVLWRNAKEQIKESLISGNGQSFWTHQFSSGGFVANYGTHNIWLDNLVAFGVVGLALFLLTVFSISRNRERLELNALLSAVFILGSTESTFQFWKLSGGIPFFLMIILFSNESFRDGILHKNLPAKSTVRKRFLK